VVVIEKGVVFGVGVGVKSVVVGPRRACVACVRYWPLVRYERTGWSSSVREGILVEASHAATALPPLLKFVTSLPAPAFTAVNLRL
jgi:hypothetical protein